MKDLLVLTQILVDVACMPSFFQLAVPFCILTPDLKERSRICHGIGTIIASDDHGIEVNLFYFQRTETI